ncbi:hypothetical protein CPB84DRAFT_222956 [Gymnopilus junonius]|uniref:Uncharacterized protein n=1 Tax=Gymnopilus junonius TaxID=109634 RepID=A0A9P5NGG0_GYMJU|nr:hypothetical protein CPB84DRAFT_222956 [Gymnopilus junonius]
MAAARAAPAAPPSVPPPPPKNTLPKRIPSLPQPHLPPPPPIQRTGLRSEKPPPKALPCPRMALYQPPSPNRAPLREKVPFFVLFRFRVVDPFISGEKTKWVPIPPEELQAAADAVLKSRNQSQPHSRNRSNHPRNTNSTSSPLNMTSALPHTRSQSGRTSASHSRVQSRAGSIQSSPRVARSKQLPIDENPSPKAVEPTDASSTSDYISPSNSNLNFNHPSHAVPNGVYHPPPSAAVAIQSPPPPSFHASTPAFYPQGLNGASPLHHLTPPPSIGSPLSPSSPPTHPYPYPMPMYSPYDYTAPGPSFAPGLNPYAPWQDYPPPPRHHLSGQQSPIYPPPPPQHFALQGHDTPPPPISLSGSVNGAPVAPALLNPSASTSSSAAREKTMVFGSISLGSRSPDPLSVPLPLSSAPSASGVNGGTHGASAEAEKLNMVIGKTPTFSIGVDTDELASGSVPARLRSRAKAGEGVNGVSINGKEKEEEETVESSSSPGKTRAPTGAMSASTSAAEVKKWKFGTMSSEGANTSLPPSDVSKAGPSNSSASNNNGVVVPMAVQMHHSATMPEISTGGLLISPPPAVPFALEARSSPSFVLPAQPPRRLSSASSAPLEVDPSLAPPPAALTEKKQ